MFQKISCVKKTMVGPRGEKMMAINGRHAVPIVDEFWRWNAAGMLKFKIVITLHKHLCKRVSPLISFLGLYLGT